MTRTARSRGWEDAPRGWRSLRVVRKEGKASGEVMERRRPWVRCVVGE